MHTHYTHYQCLNYNLTFIHCSFGVIQFYPKSHWSGTRVTTISGHWRHTWVVGMQIWRLQSIIDPDSWSWTWMCHWTMNTKDYILNPDLTITIEIPRIQLCFKKWKFTWLLQNNRCQATRTITFNVNWLSLFFAINWRQGFSEPPIPEI